jgi:hypothetical protein
MYGNFIVRGAVVNAYPLMGEDSEYAGCGPNGCRNRWLIDSMSRAAATEDYGNFFNMEKIKRATLGRLIVTRKKEEKQAIYPNNEADADKGKRGLHITENYKYLFYKWCCCIMKEKNDVYFISDKSLEQLAVWANEKKFWKEVSPLEENRSLWNLISMSQVECENLVWYFETYPSERDELKDLVTSGIADDMFSYFCRVAFIHEWMINHDEGSKVGAKTSLYAFEHVLRMIVTDEYAGLIEDFDRDVSEDDCAQETEEEETPVQVEDAPVEVEENTASDGLFDDIDDMDNYLMDIEIPGLESDKNNKRPADHELVQPVAKQPRVGEGQQQVPPSPTPSLFSLPELDFI